MRRFSRAVLYIMAGMYVVLSWAAQTPPLVVLSQLVFLTLVAVVGRSVSEAEGGRAVWPQLFVRAIGHRVKKLLPKGKAKDRALRGAVIPETRALPAPGENRAKEQVPSRAAAKRSRKSR